MNKAHEHLIAQNGATKVIDTLEPFVTDRRKQRIASVLDNRLTSIQLAIESPSDINNALAAIRSCEAFGISTIHIITPEKDTVSMHTITQGAFYWLDIVFYQTVDEFLQVIKKSPLILAGATVDGPTLLSDVSINQPLCLMVGNEQRGLSDKARAACDLLYRIPMTGMSESLNLSVSAAISLYDTVQRKRQALEAKGDLTLEQAQMLKARFYMKSVSYRILGTLESGVKS